MGLICASEFRPIGSFLGTNKDVVVVVVVVVVVFWGVDDLVSFETPHSY